MPSIETLAARSFQYRRTAVIGWREFLALNPPRVVAYATVPRLVLQLTFFVLLGQLVGGEDQRRYNFVGALAVALMVFTAVGVSEVPVHDKMSDTFWRLRIGRLDPFWVLVVRAWPYPVMAFCCGVLAFVMVAPVMGLTGLGLRLVPLLPFYALIAFTSTAIGLAGAALAVGKRADVLVGNLLAYIILVGGGGLLPAGRIGWIDTVGTVLPMRHGLAAVRAALAHRPFAAELLGEVVVGVGWLAAAWVVVKVQVHRAGRSGHDHYA